MFSLTRLFKGLLGDKGCNSIACSGSSAPQSHAAGRGGFPAEGTNCLSAVLFRGAGNGNPNDGEDARPDRGNVKSREATDGHSPHQPRPFSGLRPRDGAVGSTSTLEERRYGILPWRKSAASDGRRSRKALSRETGPANPPAQPGFALPESSSVGAADAVVTERATCPAAASAQYPIEAAAAAPERHTFPKAQAGQLPRSRQDPDPESVWNGGNHSCSPHGKLGAAGAAGCGQLAAPSAPKRPIALREAGTLARLLASCGPGLTAAHPVSSQQCSALPLPQHQHHHQQQQQPLRPQSQGLAGLVDNGLCGGLSMPLSAADGLLFLALDMPGAMLPPDGVWSGRGYSISHQLHRGYASSVFKAVCRTSGADVVLKAYNLAGLSEFLLYQLLRELDIHSRLRHPGAVKLLAAFKEGDSLVMVQEYAGGGSACRVRRNLGGRMTEFQAMHLVLLPLLGVLSYLHERGIVHRDIKPENLLFTESWQLKLCDYGVSICLREERAVTRTGSREYMAPEVSTCPLKYLPEDNKTNTDLAYSPAVDVWSLGSLMYELLVGFTPFPGGPPARREGARGSAGAALAFPSRISQEARAFIRDCLQLEPADRPTVHQLLEHAWVREALMEAANGAEGALLAAEERRRQNRCGPTRPQSSSLPQRLVGAAPS